jgi:hypothetical protein
VVTDMCMGLANEREAFISYSRGTQALSRRHYAMLDLSGFVHRDVPESARFHNRSYRDNIHVRANPQLTALAIWCTSHSPTGCSLACRGGGGLNWVVNYEHHSRGALHPLPDGSGVFCSRGMIMGRNRKIVGNSPRKEFPGCQLFPVHGTHLFVQLSGDRTFTVRGLDWAAKTGNLRAPCAVGSRGWERGSFTVDRQIWASGPINRVAFVNNAVKEVRVLDLGLKVDLPAPAAPARPEQPKPPRKPAAAPAAKPAAPRTAGSPEQRRQEKMKKDCEHWFQMYRNYRNAGIKDQARRYLQKIIDRYPKSPHAQRARKAIGDL